MGVRALNVLGVPLTLEDGRRGIRAVVTAGVGALGAGLVYGVIPAMDTTTDITTSAVKNDGSASCIVPVTNSIASYHGVAERIYNIGDVALLIVGGPTQAIVDGTVGGGCTVGTSFLKLTNAVGVNPVVDGAAQTANSIALCCGNVASITDATVTTKVLCNIQMLGLPSVVA